jgi:Domain of unknown function (DUF1877)
MHRALSDGSLEPGGGLPPLNRVIFGGQHLHDGEDYFVVLVPKDEVPSVAKALAAIDERSFQERYLRLVPPDYAPEYGEDDLAYTCDYFVSVKELLRTRSGRGTGCSFHGGSIARAEGSRGTRMWTARVDET